MQKFYFYTLLAVFFIGSAARAQSFSTKVSSATIGKKDVLEVSYVAENVDLRDLVLPVFNGWSIISGPNFSSSSYTNGTVSKQQVSYTILLQPQTTGRLTIPGAKASVNSKTQLSNSVAVTVKDADHVQGNQQAQQRQPIPPAIMPGDLGMGQDDASEGQFLKKGESARDKIANNLFIKLEVNKTKSYVGEPILATYKLCTRIRSQSRVVKQPSFAGCTVMEMTAEDPLPQREKFGNKWYNVYVIRQVQLIPLQAGRLDLPQAGVENQVTFYREGQVNYRDLFYNNPSSKPEELTVTLSSNTKQVEVLPLPQPAPPTFTGAVGRFEIHINNTNTGGATNNSNQLEVSIEGKGNLQQSRAPVISWPKGLEGFDATEKDEVDKSVFPANTRKIFSYPYVASASGNYTVPEVSFTYFDANEAKYVAISTKPFNMHIEKGVRAVISPASTVNSDEEDFRTRLYVLLGAGLLTIIIGLIWFSKKPKKPATPGATEPSKDIKTEPVAEVDTDQYIIAIRELEPTVSGSSFYRQLHRYIESWLSGKLHIVPAQLGEYAVQNPQALLPVQKLQSVLDCCSVGMYTPLYNVEDAVQHRLTALEAINHLDKLS